VRAIQKRGWYEYRISAQACQGSKIQATDASSSPTKTGEIMNSDMEEMLRDGLMVADKLLEEIPYSDVRMLIAQSWVIGKAAGMLEVVEQIEANAVIEAVKH